LLPFTAAPVRVGIVLAVLPGVALGQPAVAARVRGNRNISIIFSFKCINSYQELGRNDTWE
jgi:hypothetical protein